jgi:hypothetical protein
VLKNFGLISKDAGSCGKFLKDAETNCACQLFADIFLPEQEK